LLKLTGRAEVVYLQTEMSEVPLPTELFLNLADFLRVTGMWALLAMVVVIGVLLVLCLATVINYVQRNCIGPAESTVREVLHIRLDYGKQHVLRFGQLSGPAERPDLVVARRLRADGPAPSLLLDLGPMSGAIHAAHPLLVTFIAGDRLHFACSIQRIRRSSADVHGLPAFRAHGMIVSAE
jgi:hypothetical protein